MQLMSLLCIYYDMMDKLLYEMEFVPPNDCYRRRHGFPELTYPNARALIEATGNYTFMLALPRVSSQYTHTSRGFRAVLSDAVQDIDKHVRAHLARMLVAAIGKTGKGLQTWIVNFVEGQMEGRDDGHDLDLVDTGEFDGPAVQECWRLFKAVLVEAGCPDLLPPPGYKVYGGMGQPCLKKFKHRE